MDYLIEIEIETVNGLRWVNEDFEGDLGTTCNIENAQRYATRNEAHENLNAIRRKYPNRRYKVVAVEESENLNARLIRAASNLLDHAKDLRAGFAIRTSTDATMLVLGTTVITEAEQAIQFAKEGTKR